MVSNLSQIYSSSELRTKTRIAPLSVPTTILSLSTTHMEVIAEEEIDLIWCWMDSTATNMKATHEWTTGRLLLGNLMCNPLYSSSSPKRTTTQNGFILFRNIALLCTACFSPMGYIHRGRSSFVFLLFHVHSLYCFGISFTMRIPRQRALREESLSFPTNT